MTGEPTCRACYAHSLPDAERERFLREPVTMPVHYCDRHEAVVRDLHTLAASLPFIKAQPSDRPAEFPRCTP